MQNFNDVGLFSYQFRSLLNDMEATVVRLEQQLPDLVARVDALTNIGAVQPFLAQLKCARVDPNETSQAQPEFQYGWEQFVPDKNGLLDNSPFTVRKDGTPLDKDKEISPTISTSRAHNAQDEGGQGDDSRFDYFAYNLLERYHLDTQTDSCTVNTKQVHSHGQIIGFPYNVANTCSISCGHLYEAEKSIADGEDPDDNDVLQKYSNPIVLMFQGGRDLGRYTTDFRAEYYFALPTCVKVECV